MTETHAVRQQGLPIAVTALEESASRRQARLARLAQERANLDDRALEVAKTGLQLCLVALAETGRGAQRRRTETLVDGMSLGMEALEMQRIASAVDVFHGLGVRATEASDGLARVEITGAAGANADVATELRRDDPTRLAGVLAVLAEAGLGDRFGVVGGAERALATRRGA